MFLRIFGWLRFAWQQTVLAADALNGPHSPKHLAWGFILGMLLGLVPKDNLTAVILGLLLLVLEVNLSAGLVASSIFSLVAPWIDPLAHRLGYWLLTWPVLQPFWSAIYQWPLVPWLKWHNTVVLGSLLVGLWLAYPAFVIVQRIAQRWGPTRAAADLGPASTSSPQQSAPAVDTGQYSAAGGPLV